MTYTQNLQPIPVLSFCFRIGTRIAGVPLSLRGLCEPGGSCLLTKPALQKSPLVWPLVQGKEPLCSTLQTAEPTLSPQAPGISFNLHFSSWWPCTGWHLWVDIDKRKWKPGLNHRSESINWTLSRMCGKYNCCFPLPLGLRIQGSSFRMGGDVYKELSFFPDSAFFADYNLYLKTFPMV